MISLRFYWLFLSILCLLPHPTIAEEKTFVVNSTSSLQGTEVGDLMERKARILYQTAGIDIEYIYTTPKRASLLLSQSKIDAVSSRFRKIGDANPQLVRLDPDFGGSSIIAICLKKQMCKEYQKFKIGHLDVFKYAKQHCTKQGLICHAFGSNIGLHRALLSEFIDVIVAYEVSAETIKKFQINANIYVKKLTELSLRGHHYLHVSNKKYLPRLSKALIKMHRSGVIEKMHQEYQNKNFQQAGVIVIP